ncbi:energy transducer TonB [Cognatilysobacter lacus]|nr:energy transducer TonB [Lysobacter lacus]
MQTIHAPRVAQLDPGRITAITGAIAINGLLLALLVAPVSAPMVATAVRETFTTYVPTKIKDNPPPPKPEPIRVKVEQTHTASSQPHAPDRPHPTELPPIADHAEAGDFVVPPDDSHDTAHETGGDQRPADDGKPLTGAHLEYATNPAPGYPREELLNGDTGTVLLEVLVEVDGRPLEVSISRSSGHRALDLAAKRAVLSSWRFKPAMRNGQAVQAIGLVPVEFKLQ